MFLHFLYSGTCLTWAILSNEETQKVAINFAEALQIGNKYSHEYRSISGQSIFQEPDSMFVYSSENVHSISNTFVK